MKSFCLLLLLLIIVTPEQTLAFSSSSPTSPNSKQMTPLTTTTTNTNTNNINMIGMNKKQKFKGILFDMDGTLLDSETLGCKAVYLTLKDYMSLDARMAFEQQRNYKMEWDLKQQTLGLPGPKWSQIVVDWATKHWGCNNNCMSAQDFLQKWDQIMYEHMHEVETMKGATELVQALASLKKNGGSDNENGSNDSSDNENTSSSNNNNIHLPMAIATSSFSKSVELKRQKHENNIFQYMDVIVSGDDKAIQNGKPAPDIYIEAAKRIGVSPKDCIVFEDGMPGVQAGKAAGCFVVAIPDSRYTEEERKLFQQEADLVLYDLTQFDINILFH